MLVLKAVWFSFFTGKENTHVYLRDWFQVNQSFFFPFKCV